uniref:Uncharacterized protein n=1 Tax=Trichogramma kaykai TaxID=54128 RepID=A0ABD2X1V0_9HYME
MHHTATITRIYSSCAPAAAESDKERERERKERLHSWADNKTRVIFLLRKIEEPWVQILVRTIGFFRLSFGGMRTHVIRVSRAGFFSGGWRRRYFPHNLVTHNAFAAAIDFDISVRGSHLAAIMRLIIALATHFIYYTYIQAFYIFLLLFQYERPLS